MISIAQIRDHVRGGAPEAALLKVFVNLLNKERTSLRIFKKFGKYFISILHCIFVVRPYTP